MASSLNVQSTVNWTAPFLNYQPLTIGGVEPALSIANIVLQTILGPPFCWRWNRNSVNFACTGSGNPVVYLQDYPQALADFGFIEKAWLKSADGKDIKEIEVKNALSQSTETGRPKFIAAQGDDNAGNITFRLLAAPEQAYSISVLYQMKPRVLLGLSQSWRPIPDEYGYIYQWGFLALASILVNDQRFPIFNQKFTSHLLGAQEGLDEMQKNIFLGNWLEITKAVERAQVKTNQGITARQQ